MNAERFRMLMRNQVAGVAIIAAGNPGTRRGLTATSVTSLSDSPPTILVCVHREASAHEMIRAHRAFSVNMLRAGQRALADVFAGRSDLTGEARFEGDRWTTLRTGAPVLKDGLAALDCQLADDWPFATHTVFIGTVLDGLTHDAGNPLAYFEGRYASVGPLQD